MEILAADGFRLGATLYEGGPDAVVVASAMGVPRRYYDAFARFMADAGMSVVTFDYRGIGDSRPSSLRGFEGSMRDWGALDLPAAIGWIGSELRPRSLTLVGHSCGGQLVPFAHNAGEIDRYVFVAAQSGYWRHWSGRAALRLRTLWTLMPPVSAALGYFPARRFGLGPEDLPRQVATQWGRWGRKPSYLFDQYAAWRITAPILAWSFEDDDYATRAAVEALLQQHPEAVVTRRHEPARGVKHFGFFRRQIGEGMWKETVDWLQERRSP